MSNAEELGNAMLSRARDEDRGLIVDLSGVRYLDSSGISALFELERRLGIHRQELRVVIPPQASIRRALELVGFDATVKVDNTLEAATKALEG